jgi:hypothetical protein
VTVRARKVSGSINPYLELYNPGGAAVASGAQIDKTLTAAGTYTLLVRDYSNVNTGPAFAGMKGRVGLRGHLLNHFHQHLHSKFQVF